MYNNRTEETTTGTDGFIARIGYAYDSKWGYINKVTYPGAASGQFGRSIHYDNDIYGRAMNVRNNTSTGAVLAHLAYDNQGRRSVLTFGSGAVNEYKYGTNGKRIDQLSEWRVTPNGQAPITRLFDYNANDYLTSTGEWSIQNDSLGRIQQTTGHGVRTFRGHDDFGNNIYHQATGLIYIRGRYYSPKWHRFINSDQGVDPNSINQFAYVNGRPFMATDPSGMEVVCDLLTTYTFLVLSDGRWYLLNVAEQIINCHEIYGGGEKEEDKENWPPAKPTEKDIPCEVRWAIMDAVNASNSKNSTDKWGGFHEEGGIWDVGPDGNILISPSQPGAVWKTGDPQVFVDPFLAADQSITNSLYPILGQYQVHPKGNSKNLFNQPPSSGDIANATLPIINIVADAASQRIYFYDNHSTINDMSFKDFMKGCEKSR